MNNDWLELQVEAMARRMAAREAERAARRQERAQPRPAAISKRRVKTKCGARTRAGSPCRMMAQPNGRCRLHGGLSTGPKTAEGKARARENLKKRWAKSARTRAHDHLKAVEDYAAVPGIKAKVFGPGSLGGPD